MRVRVTGWQTVFFTMIAVAVVGIAASSMSGTRFLGQNPPCSQMGEACTKIGCCGTLFCVNGFCSGGDGSGGGGGGGGNPPPPPGPPACTEDSDCPAGQVCDNGICKACVATGAGCNTGDLCCSRPAVSCALGPNGEQPRKCCYGKNQLGCRGHGDCCSGLTCVLTGPNGRSECRDVWCGDGKLQAGEDCDDGNADDLDGCDSSCRCAPRRRYCCPKNFEGPLCTMELVSPGSGVQCLTNPGVPKCDGQVYSTESVCKTQCSKPVSGGGSGEGWGCANGMCVGGIAGSQMTEAECHATCTGKGGVGFTFGGGTPVSPWGSGPTGAPLPGGGPGGAGPGAGPGGSGGAGGSTGSSGGTGTGGNNICGESACLSAVECMVEDGVCAQVCGIGSCCCLGVAASSNLPGAASQSSAPFSGTPQTSSGARDTAPSCPIDIVFGCDVCPNGAPLEFDLETAGINQGSFLFCQNPPQCTALNGKRTLLYKGGCLWESESVAAACLSGEETASWKLTMSRASTPMIAWTLSDHTGGVYDALMQGCLAIPDFKPDQQLGCTIAGSTAEVSHVCASRSSLGSSNASVSDASRASSDPSVALSASVTSVSSAASSPSSSSGIPVATSSSSVKHTSSRSAAILAQMSSALSTTALPSFVKYEIGSACEYPTQCETGWCVNRICVCVADAQCKAGVCRRGTCVSEFVDQVAGELSLITLGTETPSVLGNLEGRGAAPEDTSSDVPLAPLAAIVTPVADSSESRLQDRNFPEPRAPDLEKTGPATLLFMAGGAAIGWAGLRRRRK